jgi:uncharacterized protein YqeY
MSLAAEIKNDFLTAFKAKQAETVSVLRLLKSALTNKEIAQKLEKGQELPNDDVAAVIKTEVKKRKDSYQSYMQAGRDDLASKEEAEIKILEKYLPVALSETAIYEVVDQVKKEMGASGPSDFGKVMGMVMAKLQGQADGALVSKAVKNALSK